ncbi:porin family protein [Leptothrix discophora]|uniref:Outer membrane beta-barrel protein n=1 Tax=Leptothrix discophora TaxID=89 RepID=A0ABT9FY61_LEPDI|nr:hypothetical protein [Leptothrix discophora]MDP4299153.1 hypothetical protein [Leptothrix discophora]
MKPSRHPNPIHALARAAACAGAMAVVCGSALAQSSPYYLGASLGVTHDNNLDRAKAGVAAQPVLSDSYVSTGVRLGADLPIGRQRVQGRFDANRNRYNTYGQYDHNDYLLNGRLDWSSADLWSGNVLAETRQSLDRSDLNSTSTVAGRNLVKTDVLGLGVRLGGPTQYTFDAGLTGTQVRYDTSTSRNVRQLTGNGGVTMRPGSGLQVRLGARHTRADYPNFNAGAGDDVRRNDIDLSSVIEASGASTFNVRLSRTRETHSAQFARTYTAWTGSTGWTWKPSPKLSFETSLTRDSNIGNTAFDNALFSFDTSDTRLRTSLALRASWELTGKVLLGGGATYSRRTLDNALVSGAGSSSTSASDRTVAWDLSLRYLPMRNVELGCGLRREDRSVSDPNVTITYAYDVTVVSCSGQLYWR